MNRLLYSEPAGAGPSVACAKPRPWAWLLSLMAVLMLLLALVPTRVLAQDRNIGWDDLPREGRATLQLILQGGPFPYAKDATVFGNREKLLPAQPRGYYREYTVPTPGASNRGARRIVAGSGRAGDPATSGEYWYTADHYQSFRRVIMPNRQSGQGSADLPTDKKPWWRFW